MIIEGEKLKNACRKEGLAALCHAGPRVKCRFDNGQEFYSKKSESPIFSWRAKGDLTVPLIPFTVGMIAAAVTLSHLFSNTKKR